MTNTANRAKDAALSQSWSNPSSERRPGNESSQHILAK
jgi:hypothetical protein